MVYCILRSCSIYPSVLQKNIEFAHIRTSASKPKPMLLHQYIFEIIVYLDRRQSAAFFSQHKNTCHFQVLRLNVLYGFSSFHLFLYFIISKILNIIIRTKYFDRLFSLIFVLIYM